MRPVLVAILLLASPAWAQKPAPRRVALERVVQLLQSRAGHEIAQRALVQARAAHGAGKASPFEQRLLRDAWRLQHLDRHRQRLVDPRGKRGWQRFNRRGLHEHRAATSLLNSLGAAVVLEREAYHPQPVRGPERKVAYLDLDRVQKRYGKGAAALVEALLGTDKLGDKGGSGAGESISWWTGLNGVDPKIARALSDPASLKPHMPAIGWAVKRFGSLEGKLKGALVRWPLRGNTLGLLGDTGLPLSNTVVWGDKDHFTDPRVAVAARALDRKLGLRGAPAHEDHRFIERWIRGNLRKLTAAEKRSTRPLFLISDDGGHLVEAVADVLSKHPDLLRHAHLFAGVEQTSSGSDRLAKKKLPFKVISWARSEGKTYSGGLMWSYAVVSQAARNMQRLARQGVHFGRDKAVVLGAGAMGRAATQWLRYLGFKRIELWDKDPALRKQYKLRDDKIEVLADADLVLSFTSGNRSLGKETLEAYVARGKKPKSQLWVNGGSPTEIGKLSAKRLRPRGLRTDRAGTLSALWDGGKRVTIGRRSDGPDLDRFVEHKGWRVVSLRDGRVANGQSTIGGVRHSLFERSGAMFYGNQPLDRRVNDPVTGYAIQFELAMMHLSHLHALGLSSEGGARAVAGNANLLALPAGPGSRQQEMVHAAMSLGTNLMIAEQTNAKGHFFIW